MGAGSPPADASKTWAVIVDGATGAGYVYQGAGAGCCWPGAARVLRRASYQMSIPYTSTRQAPLLYRETFALPPCGRFASFGPGAVMKGMATALVPTGPCQGQARTLVQITHGRVNNAPHSQVG